MSSLRNRNGGVLGMRLMNKAASALVSDLRLGVNGLPSLQCLSTDLQKVRYSELGLSAAFLGAFFGELLGMKPHMRHFPSLCKKPIGSNPSLIALA